jgi:linearmycin/streptolysin S transport system permease protein
MSRIVTLALKDLRVLSRDWFGLFWIFVFPLLFALFFGAIFSGQGGGPGRALPIAVIDEEKTPGSREFVERLKKSSALRIDELPAEEASDKVRRGDLVAYLILKSGFSNAGGMFGGPPRRIEMGLDPKRQAEAGFLKGLIMEAAFADMKDLFSDPSKANEQMQKMLAQVDKDAGMPPALKEPLRKLFGEIEGFLDTIPKQKDGKGAAREMIQLEEKAVTGNRTGPRNSFEITFPSSIMWGIMGCLAAFSISIVIERVQGTLLRLRTAPLTRNQLLAGKGLACFLSCVFVTLFLMILASLVFGVRLGNLAFLAMATVSTAICFTGLMMFVSTLGKTEAGVAGAGWGIMMPFAMLGGGMVPLIAMPPWMQTASNVSPVKWGIIALEGAIWRGFSFADMLLPCAILIAVGAAFYAVGVWSLSRQQL